MSRKNLNEKKVSVYMLNSEVVKTEMVEKKLYKNKEEIVTNSIIEYLTKELFIKGYQTKELNSYRGYDTCMLVKSTYTIRMTNNEFFAPILINKNMFNVDVLDNKAVIFLSQNDKVFIMTVGSSYGNIAPIIDDYFGIKVLGKCITQETFDVYSQKTQPVTGYEKLNNSSYRNGCSLTMIKKIEEVLKEIGGKLDKKILPTKLQCISEKDMISVNAKSSISFGNKITLDQTFDILDWICEIIDSDQPNVILNGMELVKKKSKEYEQYLNRVKDNLWELFCLYLQGDQNINQYDIMYKEPELFLISSRIELKSSNNSCDFEGDITLGEIFSKINQEIDKDEFIELIDKLVIIGYDEEDYPITTDKFINHLSGEVPCTEEDNNQVIIMDGEIIKLNINYIESINEKLGAAISERKYNNTCLLNWNDSEDETKYIERHADLGALIIHPKKFQNIELCDLIFKKDDTYHLVFIKKGYDYNVRDLASQMRISKLLTRENRFTDYVNALFDKLKKYPNSNVDKFDKEDLIQAIRLRKVVFVFAIYDKKDCLLEEQENYESNIAKISLDDLIGEFNRTSHQLKIHKIS